VALRVLRLRPLDRPGLVLIPIGERTELGIAATGLLFGLSPGSVLIEVDHERRAMVWHVIDARDPEAVRARFARFYDRYQRPVIP
jgi:multisubunit Na+/H+ antiporter MnhE subunit